ncbi:ribonuclease H1 [Galendromus occidentalis]|uniref:Ribonuclease H1 n=1 Tax=Galendromus occidentalis TaxID=34638 RepID=A0AAJ6W0A1_9ACAR|nr:ribonuclease H1 [Galendromus occidentalis]
MRSCAISVDSFLVLVGRSIGANFSESRRFLRMPRRAAGGSYYAINSGRSTGVVNSWAECESLVKGYSGAKFKRFDSYQEAQNFARGNGPAGASASSTSARSTAPAAPVEHAFVPSFTSSYAEPPPRSRPRREVPVVYTDGACSGNGMAGAKAGIGVYWGDGDPRNVSEPLKGKPTNNRAEIQAATRAIQQAKEQGYEEVEIRTDSDFLVQSTTKWMPGWQEKNWKTAAGKPVINKEDFEDLLEASKGIDVKWTHVNGHSGIHGNEQADNLAVSGMLKNRNGDD